MRSESTRHNGRSWKADGTCRIATVEARPDLPRHRLTYDAAVTKVEKARNSKKDKDREEAEDEYSRAKSR